MDGFGVCTGERFFRRNKKEAKGNPSTSSFELVSAEPIVS
jgi:hypothetical protein